MQHFALVGVTLLSILSIALHAIHLNDYKPNDPTSIVAIVSTGSLFILPWAKGFIPYVGEWVFILASLTSLISQAISFGQYHLTDAHDILLISVIASVGGAFLGHYIRKRERVWHGNQLVHKLKMLFVVGSIIVFLLDAKIEPKPIYFDVLLMLTIICVTVYTFIAFVLAATNKNQIKHSYIQLVGMHTITMEEAFHHRRKAWNLVTAAVPLTVFSIFVGEDPTTVNIVVLSLFVVALALEHINALYFS